MSTANIHDDASAFPCFDEALAEVGGVELDDEVVHVADEFQESGGVGVDLFAEGAAVDDLAAWSVHHGSVGGDGGAKGADFRGGEATLGGIGLDDGSLGEVADGGGLIDEFLRAQFDDLGPGVVHLACAVEVAGLFEVVVAGAGEAVGGILQDGLGGGLGISGSARGGLPLRGLVDDGGVARGELGEVGAEIGGVLALPDRCEGFVLGDTNAGAHHVEMILCPGVHR